MSNGTSNGNAMAHPAVIIAQMFFNFATLAVTLYIAHLSSNNTDKIEQVTRNQTEIDTKTDNVKSALDEKTKEQARSTEIQLWSTWKYLESIAEGSGSPEDKLKAIEAKRLFDEQVRKNGKK